MMGFVLIMPAAAWGILFYSEKHLHHIVQHMVALITMALAVLMLALEMRGLVRGGAAFFAFSSATTVISFLLSGHAGRVPRETTGHVIVACFGVSAAAGLVVQAVQPHSLWSRILVILSTGVIGIIFVATDWVWAHRENEHVDMMTCNSIVAAGSYVLCWIAILRYRSSFARHLGGLRRDKQPEGDEMEPIGMKIDDNGEAQLGAQV
jgi:undecaprenyl pyrophosphate phosphatase UppP